MATGLHSFWTAPPSSKPPPDPPVARAGALPRRPDLGLHSPLDCTHLQWAPLSGSPADTRKKGQQYDSRFFAGTITDYNPDKHQWTAVWTHDADFRGGNLTEHIGPQELKRRLPSAQLAKHGRETSDATIEQYLSHAEPGPAWYLRQNQPAALQQWHAACRTDSDLDVTRAKRHAHADGSCECGAPREDAEHLFLECPLYSAQRGELLTDLQDFQKSMQQENKKVFGPQATLPLTAKGGLRWIHTNRPAALYGKTHTAGNQLRHTARHFYLTALEKRRSPAARHTPGAPVTTMRTEQSQLSTDPPAHQHRKRKRDQFRQAHKRARLGRRL